MKADIQEKLNQIFRSVFQDSGIEVTEQMTANDVERWDSLSHVEMIAEVEKSFGIKFQLKEIMKFKNVGDMATVIEKRLS